MTRWDPAGQLDVVGTKVGAGLQQKKDAFSTRSTVCPAGHTGLLPYLGSPVGQDKIAVGVGDR